MADPKGSPSGSLNKWDLVMSLLPVLYVGSIAMLQYAQDHLTGMDLGPWGPFVLSGIAGALALLKRLTTDTRKP